MKDQGSGGVTPIPAEGEAFLACDCLLISHGLHHLSLHFSVQHLVMIHGRRLVAIELSTCPLITVTSTCHLQLLATILIHESSLLHLGCSVIIGSLFLLSKQGKRNPSTRSCGTLVLGPWCRCPRWAVSSCTSRRAIVNRCMIYQCKAGMC